MRQFPIQDIHELSRAVSALGSSDAFMVRRVLDQIEKGELTPREAALSISALLDQRRDHQRK